MRARARVRLRACVRLWCYMHALASSLLKSVIATRLLHIQLDGWLRDPSICLAKHESIIGLIIVSSPNHKAVVVLTRTSTHTVQTRCTNIFEDLDPVGQVRHNLLAQGQVGAGRHLVLVALDEVPAAAARQRVAQLLLDLQHVGGALSVALASAATASEPKRKQHEALRRENEGEDCG